MSALRGTVVNQAIEFIVEVCCNCGQPFMMTTDRKDWLRTHPGELFYCPNGHPQSYVGKTEAQKLREELNAVRIDSNKQIYYLQSKVFKETTERKKLNKILKRVHNGVCPCCNRHFTNLENHIVTKHPEILKREKPNPLHVKISNKKT